MRLCVDTPLKMSKVKIGDKVRYLSDVGGGTVVAIISKDKVVVLDSSGFEIPVMAKELVVIETTEKKIVETAKNDDLLSKKNVKYDFYPVGHIIQGRNEAKTYFAFVSQKAKYIETEYIDIYLINDCNYTVFYHIMTSDTFNSKELQAGLLAANSNEKIATLKKTELFSLSEFILHLIFYKKDKYKALKPLDNRINMEQTGVERESMFRKNLFFDNPALILPISDKVKNVDTELQINNSFLANKYIFKNKLKEDIKKQSPPKTKPETKREIDLHIHNLIDSTTGLTPAEILNIQMAHFHTEINKAISDNIKRIIFIHGLGNGTLKTELRKELGKTYGKYAFHDASFKEYGFGATLIILNNN